jgi:hypothetical protein
MAGRRLAVGRPCFWSGGRAGDLRRKRSRRSLEFYEQAFGWPRNQRIDYRN